MTTTPSAVTSRSSGKPGDALVAKLTAMRNRAIRTLAIRYYFVAAVPAVVAGDALSVATAAGAAQTLTILALALAASLALAIGAAVRRAPTLAGTAAIVDRTQRLESRATTGLQFAAQDDPVSLLVIRDATARLGACEPAAVFPIELPQRWPWMLGAAAAASLFVALTLGGVVTSQPADGPGAGATGGSAQVRSSNDSSRVVSSPQVSTPTAERPGSPAIAPQGVTPPADGAAASRGTAAAPRGGSDEREPGSASSRGASPAGLASRAPANASTPAIGSSASSGSAAAAGASLSSASGAAGSARTGAGGAGSVPAGNLAKGAGGVKGGTLSSPATDTRLAATETPMMPNSARYRAEWERGQAAMARERVPPALRKYVRDYFAAIRPRQP